MSDKRADKRRAALGAILQRPSLPQQERPLIVLSGPAEIAAEERAAMAASPWVPRSAAELCQAAADTFCRVLGPSIPQAVAEWLRELQHKMEGAEYHLRRVQPDADCPQFEVKSFLVEVSGTLDVLTAIARCFLPDLPDTFSALPGGLRSVKGLCPERPIELAELIEGQDWLADLATIRNELTHGRGVPSLARQREGRLYLGRFTTEEFCIRIWLLHIRFVTRFLELALAIAWETHHSE